MCVITLCYFKKKALFYTGHRGTSLSHARILNRKIRGLSSAWITQWIGNFICRERDRSGEGDRQTNRDRLILGYIRVALTGCWAHLSLTCPLGEQFPPSPEFWSSHLNEAFDGPGHCRHWVTARSFPSVFTALCSSLKSKPHQQQQAATFAASDSSSANRKPLQRQSGPCRSWGSDSPSWVCS